eukprot:TRINITY_DN11231_c0_g1_i3.p1 TRINITY_DN11231_c0_g1~~TRINITY_DN11231_c0_g1_i3.p1  ORF type:complete len:219 (-),score=47.77 TRINITY_DN11231_c0_g1_i3:159-752(-)
MAEAVNEAASTGFAAIDSDSVPSLALHLDANPTHLEHKQEGMTMLFYAIFYGKFQCARYLLQRGANLHAISDYGHSAFTTLIFRYDASGFAEMVPLLAPTATIHEAAEYGLLDRVRDLLAKHPEQLNEREASGATPLMRAARYGQVEVVRFLVEAGADRDAYDYGGLGAAWFNCNAYRGEDREQRKRQIAAMLGVQN